MDWAKHPKQTNGISHAVFVVARIANGLGVEITNRAVGPRTTNALQGGSYSPNRTATISQVGNKNKKGPQRE